MPPRSADQRSIFEHSRSQFSQAIRLRSGSLSCAKPMIVVTPLGYGMMDFVERRDAWAHPALRCSLKWCRKSRANTESQKIGVRAQSPDSRWAAQSLCSPD